MRMAVEARANAQWTMDFTSDTLYRGRRFRSLNILDEGVREALAIVVDTSIPGTRVVRIIGAEPKTSLTSRAGGMLDINNKVIRFLVHY